MSSGASIFTVMLSVGRWYAPAVTDAILRIADWAHMKAFIRAIPFALLIAAQAVAHAGVLKDHQGHWLGDMKIPDGRVLKIGAEVFTRADGSVWADVASPDQGAYAIVVTRIKEDGATAELVLPFATLTTIQWHRLDRHAAGIRAPLASPDVFLVRGNACVSPDPCE